MRGVGGYVFLIVILAWSTLSGSAAAQGRALHWRELAVTASLDAEGRLHVDERHVMVFTGDWNGGERRFRLANGQRLELQSLTRIDASGEARSLVSGDLSATDQYAWSDSNTLRWRSRRPGEPAFERTELTYVLSYVLSNILVDAGGGTYRLDHDFAFPERPGVIERFTLALELAPAWRPEGPIETDLERGPLWPGMSVVSNAALHYVGAGRPSGVLDVASRDLRGASVAVLLGIVGLLFVRLFRRETRLGRFAPLTPTRSIDEAWLDRHVFSMLPELVGALHDRRISSHEVAAVIARMVLEAKLASRVTTSEQKRGRDNLELWLLVERETLAGYERALSDKLFFSGNTTSTDALREHYKGVGFNPAGLLDEALTKQADALLGIDRQPAGARFRRLWPLVLLGVCTLVGLVVTASVRESEIEAALFGVLFGVNVTALITFLAWRWTWIVERRVLAALGLLVAQALFLAGIVLAILQRQSLPPIGALSFALLGVWGTGLVTWMAASKGHASGMALRLRLSAARRYFAEELAKPEPRLRDDWFPYLLALKLGGNMDEWFRAFAGAASPTHRGYLSSSTGSGTSRSTGSSGSAGWTGGGGSFGGAGASGSWAAATGALAAGVPSPGSSSGGGSRGSSGSSSSGGGGGGGW